MVNCPPLGPVNWERVVVSVWFVSWVQPPSGPIYQAPGTPGWFHGNSSEEHTSELQSQSNLVCRLLLEKKNNHARGIGSQSRHILAALERAMIATSMLGMTTENGL